MKRSSLTCNTLAEICSAFSAPLAAAPSIAENAGAAVAPRLFQDPQQIVEIVSPDPETRRHIDRRCNAADFFRIEQLAVRRHHHLLGARYPILGADFVARQIGNQNRRKPVFGSKARHDQRDVDDTRSVTGLSGPGA